MIGSTEAGVKSSLPQIIIVALPIADVIFLVAGPIAKKRSYFPFNSLVIENFNSLKSPSSFTTNPP